MGIQPTFGQVDSAAATEPHRARPQTSKRAGVSLFDVALALAIGIMAKRSRTALGLSRG